MGDYRKESANWDRKFNDYREERIAELLQKVRDQGKYVEFRTDFDGSYDVVVPPGSWYVCNFAFPIGDSRIVWSVPVTVNAGQILKLDLENGNARAIW